MFKYVYVHTKLIPNIGLKPTAPEHARMEVWARRGMSKFVPGAADGCARRNRRGPGDFNQCVCVTIVG